MSKSIYLEKRNIWSYPSDNKEFHPSQRYPEYPFPENVSEKENTVYDMIRSALAGMDLDKDHFGISTWNPMGDIITPGDTVILKPNMVRHYDDMSQYECTLTHPSIIRAVIDYCIIAKAKKIIIGDAPIQGADMEKIKKDYYYDDLLAFYHTKGIEIKFIDFRDLVVQSKHGIIKTLKTSNESDDRYIKIDLGKYSKHYMQNNNPRYETCGYTDDKINFYHQMSKHQYVISKNVLEADVIINLPKPKTHRFAGITGAQKNFVGVCADKESLPHFKQGTPQTGGDETNKETYLTKFIHFIYRKYLWKCKKEQFIQAQVYYLLYWIFAKTTRNLLYLHGAWHGNDTIWRTIIDLNKIIFYAKSDGNLDFSRAQRKVFTIGDMIICGEKEGPLHPTPKKEGCILVSRNCTLFDYVFCKMTGFDEQLIPTVHQSLREELLLSEPYNDVLLYSNIDIFNKQRLEELRFPQEYNFVAHPYWKEIL